MICRMGKGHLAQAYGFDFGKFFMTTANEMFAVKTLASAVFLLNVVSVACNG